MALKNVKKSQAALALARASNISSIVGRFIDLSENKLVLKIQTSVYVTI